MRWAQMRLGGAPGDRGQQWGGGGWSERGLMCVCVGGGGGGQPPRTALHTINIKFQNGVSELHTWRLVSWKALWALNACWVLPVCVVFEDEKSKGSDQKLVKRKTALKRDQQDWYNCYKLRLRANKNWTQDVTSSATFCIKTFTLMFKFKIQHSV